MSQSRKLQCDDDLSGIGSGIGRLPGANLRLDAPASKDRSPSVEFAREGHPHPHAHLRVPRAGSDGRWE
jgi:hypothetical protein